MVPDRSESCSRGDPFSHPSGSSVFLERCLQPQFRTERSRPDVSDLPPARFSWSSFFTRAAPKGQAARALLLRPTPVFRDPENFQCRAAFIQHQESLVSRQLYRLPRSNPFLTHGTVESPAKCVLCHHLKVRRAAASNQPRGLKVQPLCWLAAALKNQFFIVSVLFKENCRSQSVNRALASNTFPGYGSSQVHFCLVVTPGNMRLAS